MHDLIQQMGWAIVREEYPRDASKWSRMWDVEDIHNAFSTKKVKNIETISLDLSRSKEMRFTSEVFAKMKKLRLLKVYYSAHHSQTTKEDKIRLPKDFEFPPNLRYLHWEGLEFLPPNLQAQNLVALNLKSSNLKELWEGDQDLPNLKFIDLSDSQQLVKIPKFSTMPNLERLNLTGCTSFYKLQYSSIDAFPKMNFLKELNFSGSRIKELPNSIGSLTCLEILVLRDCAFFEKFEDIFGDMGRLKILDLRWSGIKELPPSIGCLKSLEALQLGMSSKFEKYLEMHEHMISFNELSLTRTPTKKLPNTIGLLSKHAQLIASSCSNLVKIPEFPRNIGSLCDLYFGGTAIKEIPNSIRHFIGLGSDLLLHDAGIKDLPCSITHLNQLEEFFLYGCKNLTSLPSSIYQLKSLTMCDLSGCSNLEVVPEITEDNECLKILRLSGQGITELPSSIERLKGLIELSLKNCGKIETLPNSIGQLTCLSTLSLVDCPKLHKLPDTLRSLQCCLHILDIVGCNTMEGAIPDDLWCLTSLAALNLSKNINVRRIPNSIIQLSQLKVLRLNHCPMLREIPKLPSSLRRLEAYGCPCLETLSSDHDSTHLLPNFVDCFKSLIQDLTKDTYGRYPTLRLFSCSPEITLVIPRSRGLPEWVSHKSMGHEIRIELPKNWYEDNDFLGFALFFYLVPHDRSHLKIPLLPLSRILIGISSSDEFEFMDIYVESVPKTYANILGPENFTTAPLDPALRVVYVPRIIIARVCWLNAWDDAKVCFEDAFGCGNAIDFKVESCGIHLIYQHQHDDQH